MWNYAVVIPALNPTESLIGYIKSLIGMGASHFIIVNDGSKKELEYIFVEITSIDGCTVITHEVNRGKGNALKTAFQYVLNSHNELKGVITADADGQHSVNDVYKMYKALQNTDVGIILGVRSFNEKNVPARSYLGNKMTSFIFQILYGKKIKDTQTGLRGIPIKELPMLLQLDGERYDYEINMLIYATKMNLNIKEISIQTLYFRNNASSHYNPILDSLTIFTKLISGILHYSYSTLLSAILDIICFILFTSLILAGLPLELRILYSTIGARLISSTFNHYMNRKHVFNGKNKFSQSIIKYYILCLTIMVASYLLVVSANLLTGMSIILSKIYIEILLGIFSYQVQLHWVFKNEQTLEKKYE